VIFENEFVIDNNSFRVAVYFFGGIKHKKEEIE